MTAVSFEMLSGDEVPKHRPIVAADKAFVRDLAAITPDLRIRALRLTRDHALADDLVQDSIERAIRFRSQFQTGTSLRSWVQTIVFSVFVTGYRRRRREREAVKVLTVDPCAWTAGDAPTIDAQSELSPTVLAAVERLPETYQEVLMLVDVAELSYRDAAEQLDVPMGTVMSRLHRARRRLAEELGHVHPGLPVAA